jgi:hypothetical protein
MKNALNFIIDHWILITPIILEIGARVIPTEKNYSILSHAVKLLNVVIPNLKKDKNDGGITLHLIIIFVLSSVYSYAQTNSTVKALLSTNVTDTTLIQNARASLQANNGNSSGLYFDKGRNKWKIWIGTCATCTVDSAWVDLLSIGGSISNIVGTDPISVTGTSTRTISMLPAASAQAGYVNTDTQQFGGKKVFSPVGGHEGLNVGSYAGNPSSSDGGLWYNSSTSTLNAKINSSNRPLLFNASNGITATSGLVQLGGSLVQTTDISLDGSSVGFKIRDTNSNTALVANNFIGTMALVGGDYENLITDNTILNSDGTINGISAALTDGQHVFFGVGAGTGVTRTYFDDERTIKRGIEYDATGYVTQLHSLADKEYVDTKGTGTVTNVTGVSPISVATGTTTPAISLPITTNEMVYGTGTSVTSNSHLTYNSATDNVILGVSSGLHVELDDAAGFTQATASATQSTSYTYFGTTSTGTGGYTISCGNGNITIQADGNTNIVFTGLATSCSGKPTGTIINNSGVLNICP